MIENTSSYEKLSALHDYLCQNGLFKQASFIFKIANDETPEEFLEKNYPIVFEIFKNDSKPAGAYINILNNMDESQKNNISQGMSFNDLVEIMRRKKDQVRKNRRDEILDIVTSADSKQYSETKEEISEIFSISNMNDQQIEFILRDTTNHSIQDKIDFIKEMSSISGGEKTVNNFLNVDEIVSYILSDMKKDSLDGFYKAIDRNALTDSEIIYNSNKYTVILSKTGYAAKYWEQS